MEMLAEELQLQVEPANAPRCDADADADASTFNASSAGASEGTATVAGKEDVFYVPYDSSGRRTVGCVAKHQLDLRDGAEVVLTAGPNKGERATVIGRNADGHWRLRVTRRFKGKGGGKESKVFGE